MDRQDQAWAFEHSIECGVAAQFAWDFWTDVRNWAMDADVESIEIDGPFAAGGRGVTNSKSSGRVEWRIAEVDGRRAVIEAPLPGAVSRITWTFEDTGSGCRITQRWTLEGDRAATYARDFGPMLEAGIPQGMQKLCEAMQSSARPS